jgi:hypothetical protein
MNIQDVADFIALVKEPARFESAIQQMQDEQARLNAVIETVGVVAEIEKIKKSLTTKEDNLEKAYAKKQADFDQEKGIWLGKIELTEALSRQELAANKIAGQALKEKEAACKKKLSDLTTREQLLVNLEAVAAEKEAKLNAMLSEYDEKIAKLKSVMV